MRTEPADVILVPLRAPHGRRAWTIKHGGRSYAVFDVAGELQVTDAGCPHKGGPLSQGIVHGVSVTCPLHNWVIDLDSGQAAAPDEGCVRTASISRVKPRSRSSAGPTLARARS